MTLRSLLPLQFFVAARCPPPIFLSGKLPSISTVLLPLNAPAS